MLPPDGGRELLAVVVGNFGKALLVENSPLWWLICFGGAELSGLLMAADAAALFGLFVLLRRVTLLDKETARLVLPEDVVILVSAWNSDRIDLFDGTLRILTKGTAAFSWADVTEGFLVTNI